MAIGLIAGLVGGGLSYWNQKSQQNAANQQLKSQWQSQYNSALAAHEQNVQQYNHAQHIAKLQNKFQNESILQQNKHTLKIYDAKIDQYEEQLQFNEEAANRAFNGIQVNRNRKLTQLAYERQSRAAQLLEALGANDASIAAGNKSAQLAAQKATWGEYGRNAESLNRQERDMRYDAMYQAEDMARNFAFQQYQAGIPTSVEPLLQNLVPMMPSAPPPVFNAPQSPNYSSGMSNALMIGNAAMAGYNAYNMFNKPTMPSPGGGQGGGQGSMGGYGGISGNFSNNFSNNQVGLVNFKNAMSLDIF